MAISMETGGKGKRHKVLGKKKEREGRSNVHEDLVSGAALRDGELETALPPAGVTNLDTTQAHRHKMPETEA